MAGRGGLAATPASVARGLRAAAPTGRRGSSPGRLRARRRRSADPAGACGRGSPGPQSGLTSLEWLLVLGAVLALGAAVAVTVQRVVDASTDEESQRAVRVAEADTAAAVVERLARCKRSGADCSSAAALAGLDVAEECSRIARDYRDVVDSARWVEPARDGDEPRCSLVLAAE